MCEVASRRFCVRSRLYENRLLGMCRQSEGGLMAGPGVLATTPSVLADSYGHSASR